MNSNNSDIIEAREHIDQAYANGKLADEEYDSAIDALDEEELLLSGRIDPNRLPKKATPPTSEDKKYTFGIFKEILLGVLIILSVSFFFKSCELSSLENDYAELEEDYEDSYSDAYNEGYDDGYSSGYDEGYVDGSNDGYDEGYKEGQDSDAYDEGYDDGYRAGKKSKK